MTRPSDPDGWYDPDGAVLRQVRAEGMETTAEERAKAREWEVPDELGFPDGWIAALIRDLAHALARIAELEAKKEHAVYAYVSARIAELEAERDRLLIAEEDAKLFIFLHALAIECGYMPSPGESAYDLLQRAIMTRAPRIARAALSGEGVT